MGSLTSTTLSPTTHRSAVEAEEEEMPEPTATSDPTHCDELGINADELNAGQLPVRGSEVAGGGQRLPAEA